jgi:hypothetical protein
MFLSDGARHNGRCPLNAAYLRKKANSKWIFARITAPKSEK